MSVSGLVDASRLGTLACFLYTDMVASGLYTLTLHDALPILTVSADRAADHNGWYNANLTLSTSGTDATSLIDSCQADLLYSGPDDASALVSRTCTDNAGNVGSGSKSFKFDKTAPTVAVAAETAAAYA